MLTLALAVALIAGTAGSGGTGGSGDAGGPSQAGGPTEGAAPRTPDGADANRPAAKPNIVLVLADDQDAASLSVMDAVQRELVDEGTSFSNALVSLPQCCPSRATALSGQYAHNHGVLDNSAPRGGFSAFDGANALPVWLQSAGYRTGWVGKYLNGYGNPARGADPREVPPGWDRWTAPVNHTEYRLYNYTLNRDGSLRDYGSRSRDYQTDVFARRAAGFIRDNAGGGKPFFLAVSPLAPHQEGGKIDDRPDAPRNPRPAPRHRGRFGSLQLPSPPSFDEPDVSDKAGPVASRSRLDQDDLDRLTTIYRSQRESLLAVDDLIERLVATLRRTGALENTLFIYTSDQGFLHGEHRLIGKNRLYEEALRVPLVIRGPGVEPAGRRDDLVSNIDLAPTIVAASGAEPGLEMDGRSLLEAPLEAAEERPILVELFHDGRTAGVRTARHAYLDLGDRRVELYDMKADPYQLTNLAGDPSHARVQRQLAGELERLRSCSGPSCR